MGNVSEFITSGFFGRVRSQSCMRVVCRTKSDNINESFVWFCFSASVTDWKNPRIERLIWDNSNYDGDHFIKVSLVLFVCIRLLDTFQDTQLEEDMTLHYFLSVLTLKWWFSFFSRSKYICAHKKNSINSLKKNKWCFGWTWIEALLLSSHVVNTRGFDWKIIEL